MHMIDKIDKKFITVAQPRFIFTIMTQYARLIMITSAFVYEKRSAKFQDMPTFAISRELWHPAQLVISFRISEFSLSLS